MMEEDSGRLSEMPILAEVEEVIGFLASSVSNQETGARDREG